MSADALRKIYYDPKHPGFLGGVLRLQQRARNLHVPGVTRKSVKEYLKSEQAYTLHKPARRRFTRNHPYVTGIDAQWQADLADMQGIARQNGEMRYFRTVIDVFFKFAWAVPIHTKDAKSLTAAFGQVVTTANPRYLQRIQTDKGKEYFNSNFQTRIKRHGIQHLARKGEQQAAVVMRLNRTIKTRL